MFVKSISAAFFLSTLVCAQSRGPLAIGPVSADPGQITSGFLKVSPGADIPITVINGRNAGPVLVLVAGTHGYEYSPILALQRLRPKISPQTLSGAVILVHVANMPSFLRRT